MDALELQALADARQLQVGVRVEGTQDGVSAYFLVLPRDDIAFERRYASWCCLWASWYAALGCRLFFNQSGVELVIDLKDGAGDDALVHEFLEEVVLVREHMQ
jgi:hypothetical protein